MMTPSFRIIATSVIITTILSLLALTSIGTVFVTKETFAQSTTNANSTAMNATTAANNTTTAATTPQLMGVIASIQLDASGRPAWITSGNWMLQSDTPLVSVTTGNTTTTTNTTTAQPHITNFHAMLFMVSNENGTAKHTHDISNFKQTGVTHQGVNSMTVNGTFTVTLMGVPVNNVQGYIHIQNDKIEFWLDPNTTQHHFGPTTITGIVLTPQEFSSMMQPATMTQGNATMTMSNSSMSGR
jgi:hypothetical protein